MGIPTVQAALEVIQLPVPVLGEKATLRGLHARPANGVQDHDLHIAGLRGALRRRPHFDLGTAKPAVASRGAVNGDVSFVGPRSHGGRVDAQKLCNLT
jgi:hypothetical protein